MNKIAVVTMMKNEADIVESFIRHTSLFADKIYVCDHKSTDRTREILDLLKNEGLNLEVSSFERDEHGQQEVTQSLLQRAIDDGFDLVIPIDTDEFMILAGGNSRDLKKYLQNLDVTKHYQVYWDWVTHLFADEDESKYALSRDLLKVADPKKDMKVFAGREFWKKYSPTIIMGNHKFLFRESNSIKPITLDSVQYVHLSIRSTEQYVAKMATNSITAIACYSRYTLHNNHHRRFMDRYLKNASVAKIDTKGSVPADFSAYKDEVTLKFTGGGGDICISKNICTCREPRQYSLSRTSAC
ncbi:MAG: glycosyltransferase family 2 protein [Selenomonadaceae bacterium]|nr:glycosyltransferase family 2 protein [Selenomonadaceae bacterium]